MSLAGGKGGRGGQGRAGHEKNVTRGGGGEKEDYTKMGKRPENNADNGRRQLLQNMLQ